MSHEISINKEKKRNTSGVHCGVGEGGLAVPIVLVC